MAYTQADILKAITSILRSQKILYMITGAWSVIFYGRPRASHDIDLVIEIRSQQLNKFLSSISTLDSEFTFDHKHIISTIEKKENLFQIVYLPTLVKIDFWLLQDNDFDKLRFQRRSEVTILDQKMSIATAEDAILKKLSWYKESNLEKHLIDAAFIYQIQKENLDHNYLQKWAGKLKTTVFLKKLSQIDLQNYL